MSPSHKESACWVVAVAAAIVYGIYAGPHTGPIEGTALATTVYLGRQAARLNERHKAAAAQQEHRTHLLHPATIERAAERAFTIDALGGSLGWTWNNLPPQGRDNYITLVRAVITSLEKEHQP